MYSEFVIAVSDPSLTSPRRVADKTCRICGDCAVGFNFEVVTCESCKAFFRRNASSRPEQFKCAFTNNCVMTATSRRFCKHCRLKKCFEVGSLVTMCVWTEESIGRHAQGRQG